MQIWCVLLLFGRREWWHSAEEIKIFKDEVELQKRRLAVRCEFCARGECRSRADCKRAKRVEEIAEMKTKSVAPTDLGSDMWLLVEEGCVW
jgi:hypothetical protein